MWDIKLVDARNICYSILSKSKVHDFSSLRGRNRSEDIQMGIGTHPSGITGISVQCDIG